jgi:hypothetical protein
MFFRGDKAALPFRIRSVVTEGLREKKRRVGECPKKAVRDSKINCEFSGIATLRSEQAKLPMS